MLIESVVHYFLFLVSILLYGYTIISLTIHLLFNLLGCLHLAILNKTAVNILIDVFV